MGNFKIRTYGWQELAILYAPDLTPESAGKRLSSWIRFNPKQSGWKKGQRVLTPLQVRIIIQYLGEP